MDPEELIVVYYTESHPDRDRTFIGIFSSEEKAQKAQDAHMAREKARLPDAYIGDSCYTWDSAVVDCSVR